MTKKCRRALWLQYWRACVSYNEYMIGLKILRNYKGLQGSEFTYNMVSNRSSNVTDIQLR